MQIADRAAIFVKDGERRDRPLSFEITGSGQYRILVTDLAAGNWQVWRDGAVLLPAFQVRDDAGTLYFTGGAGLYEFRR